jgi:hypothetical protein
MNTRFGKVLAILVATSLVAFVTQLVAAQSYLDGSAKARGNFGQAGASSTWNGGYSYRAPASAIVRQQSAPSTVAKTPAAPAPNAVAKAPEKADTRTFSYEPQASGCGSANGAATSAPNATAKKDNGTTRSYSYEPAERTNSAPRSSQTPLYLVPKTLR